MTIRLGYACINTQLPSPNRTCRLAHATPERVIELGRQNLNTLTEILAWNHRHGIQLFRISSGIIPLASHPAVKADWWAELALEFARAGSAIREGGARVSMHPGQFTVLNSPREAVVEASLDELAYHARVLDLLDTGPDHKIVLHLGGRYGDREASMRRFIDTAARLPEAVRRRLILENDERNYSIADVLEVAKAVRLPVVFDVFHHHCNPSMEGLSILEIVERCSTTWIEQDGPPKLHYSNPWPGKQRGAHARSIDVSAFGSFYALVRGLRLDIMLEVKDKERSVLSLYDAYPELKLAAKAQ